MRLSPHGSTVFAGSARASVLILALALALTGCTSTSTPDKPTDDATKALTEGLETMTSCLADHGWEVVNASTGEMRIPPEQMSVFEEDQEACADEISGGQEIRPLSEADLGKLYDLETDAADCLGDLGYTIDVPSLQTFTDGYASGTPFSAHGALGSIPQADWDRATRECPPPGWTFQQSD